MDDTASAVPGGGGVGTQWPLEPSALIGPLGATAIVKHQSWSVVKKR